MPLLVTSAAGANGIGCGALLAFDLDGTPLGFFSNDSRIADPRGLAVDRKEGLLFLKPIGYWRSTRMGGSWTRLSRSISRPANAWRPSRECPG
jgi:hypothetical protein